MSTPVLSPNGSSNSPCAGCKRLIEKIFSDGKRKSFGYITIHESYEELASCSCFFCQFLRRELLHAINADGSLKWPVPSASGLNARVSAGLSSAMKTGEVR